MLASLLLFVALPVASPHPVQALDIPFFLSLKTSDIGIYYPERVGKKVVWDEKYLAGFGVDSLRVGKFSAVLHLSGTPELDEFVPRIKTLSISYKRGMWNYSGMISEVGFGKGYGFQQRFVNEQAYDEYLFDRGRFNRVEAEYRKGAVSTEIGIGGNTHNQAMARIRQGFTFPGVDISISARVSARDTHWNTPSVLPAITASCNTRIFNAKLDAGMNLLPAFENEPRRQELFTAGEISIGHSDFLQINLGGLYMNREYYPFDTWRTNLALSRRQGDFCISPVLDVRSVDDARLWAVQLLGEWQVVKGFDLGLYYKYGFGDDAEKSHNVGLQSSLRLDI